MYIDLTNKEEAVAKLLQKMESYLAENGLSEAEFSSAVGSSNALFKNMRKGSMPAIDRINTILLTMKETLVIGDIDASEPEKTCPSEAELEGLALCQYGAVFCSCVGRRWDH